MNNTQKAATGLSFGAVVLLMFHFMHVVHLFGDGSHNIPKATKVMVLSPKYDSVTGLTRYDTSYLK